MKKAMKKLQLHVETLRNLSGPCLTHVAGAVTQAAATICATCTRACSGCAPCR